MNWYQELTITNGTMYAGSRWLGSFSSHEAALEALSIKRHQASVISADETHCMTDEDIDLLEAIDADER